MRWILLVTASVGAAVGGYLVGRRASSTPPSPLPAAAPQPPVVSSAPRRPRLRRLRLILLILLWSIVVLLAWTLWTRNSVPETPAPVRVAIQAVETPAVAPKLAPGALGYQLTWPVGIDSQAAGHGWSGDSDWRQDGFLTNDGVIKGGTDLLALAPQLSAVIDDGDYAAEIEARFDGVGHFQDQPAAFGLMIRNSSLAVWRAGLAAGQLFIAGEPKVQGDESVPVLLARATARRAWAPGADWHTYRFAAKSKSYTLFVDGEQVLTVDSDLYRDGTTTGLWINNAVIKIRAYRVYKT